MSAAGEDAGPRPLLDVLRLSAAWLEGRGVENARRETEELLARSLGLTRMDLYLQHDRPLREEELAPLRGLLARRGAGEPLQYLLGDQPFRGAEIRVDSRVLIPRPETEQLVELALAGWPLERAGTALDVGTGSGCIAISLAQERPGLRVLALDRSPGALELAEENARANGVSDRVGFRRLDILRDLPGEPVDLLLSNPPYIAPGERAALQRELDWEPQEALVDLDDGLGFYRRFAACLDELLVSGGRFHFELGESQGEAALALFGGRAQELRLDRDLAGRIRFLSGRRPT